jgi:hypothetical protein
VQNPESPGACHVDAFRESVYPRGVPAQIVQVGQVWKKDGSGDSFLVTKIYNEALATYAVLRKTGAEDEPPVRIKVAKTGATASLPGYTFTQQSDDF